MSPQVVRGRRVTFVTPASSQPFPIGPSLPLALLLHYTLFVNTGYYAACAGLRVQHEALEVVANNLANVNTDGYRGAQPTFHSMLTANRFPARAATGQVAQPFNILGSTQLDLSSGNLRETGNALDLALEGNGFFAVQTRAGTLYTRNGSFQSSSTGQLITAGGDAVLGEQGPITLPAGRISISTDGTISVEGAVAGKLRVVELAPGASITPVGDSLYAAGEGGMQPSTTSRVRQAMLESSNVNPVASVVQLISVQRQAEMMQRALSVYYSDFNRIAAADLPRL